MIGNTQAQVPVRRRRSVFAIIGMIVVAVLLLGAAYFMYRGWVAERKPVLDVDKADAVNLPASRGTVPATVTGPSRA